MTIQEILKANAAPLSFVMICCDYDYETGQSYRSEHTAYTGEEFARANDDARDWRERNGGNYSGPETFSELMEWIFDSSDGAVVSIMTEHELQEQRIEQERLSLESYVASVVKGRGLEANDVEGTLDALMDIIGEAEARSYGLREDGLCAVGGFGQQAVADWHDWQNDLSGQADKADRAIEWLSKECPLAAARWSEKRFAHLRD